MKILRSHTTPQFEKDYLDLSLAIQLKTKRKIGLFEKNCFYGGLNTHKLKGALNGLWSFSIDDNFRVIFKFLPDHEIIYYRIGSHKIYKEMERLF